MLNSNQRTYQIRRLVEQGMLQPIHEGARIYTVGFANSQISPIAKLRLGKV